MSKVVLKAPESFVADSRVQDAKFKFFKGFTASEIIKNLSIVR